MKVVLDTNVLISAFLFKGFAALVYDHCEINETVYISPWILQEFSDNLFYKFEVEEGKIRKFERKILFGGYNITPQAPLPDISEDKDDNNILQLADHVDAEFLITGDKGLLSLESYKDTSIVSPRYFYNHFIYR